MSAVGLQSIDHTVQLTRIWINDLDARLGWQNKHRSYQLLRAVLQALRDWLPIEQAASLGAQLPELMRGVYYEHWRPGTTPIRRRHADDFLARIDASFSSDDLAFAGDAVSTVFDFLNDKLSKGEIEKVRSALPRDLRGLWTPPSPTTLTTAHETTVR